MCVRVARSLARTHTYTLVQPRGMCELRDRVHRSKHILALPQWEEVCDKGQISEYAASAHSI